MNQESTETTKTVGYTDVFTRNRASKATVVVNVGGARSSKSHSIAQLLIEKLLNEEGKMIGICRKTFPALRMTAMKMTFDLMKDYGIYQEEKHNKSFNTYTYGTNIIQFFGLDESEKIKSAEFNYIWMEEGNEFSYEDYTALKLRLSGKVKEGEQNHIYISLNPVDAHNWIATRAIKESDVEVIKSVFSDNPYLSKDYIDLLLDLINQDENSYRVYVLGEWGLLEGKIYSNYKVIPELPMMTGAKWAYGLDFGLVNPSAIVRVYLLGDKFYLEERLYQSGLTNSDIIEHFSHEERGDIYGDPSAKMMITEIQRAGYNCFEGHKGVKEGIDLCQRQTIFIPQSSAHLITEIQNYHYRKDPNATGSESFLAEPVKYNDHLMDAFRYAIWGLTSRYGWATQRPKNLEAIKSLTFGEMGVNNKVLDRWLHK
jgi:phage terminase large subunit